MFLKDILEKANFEKYPADDNSSIKVTQQARQEKMHLKNDICWSCLLQIIA